MFYRGNLDPRSWRIQLIRTWLIVLVNQSIIQTGNNSKVGQCVFIEGVERDIRPSIFSSYEPTEPRPRTNGLKYFRFWLFENKLEKLTPRGLYIYQTTGRLTHQSIRPQGVMFDRFLFTPPQCTYEYARKLKFEQLDKFFTKIENVLTH